MRMTWFDSNPNLRPQTAIFSEIEYRLSIARLAKADDGWFSFGTRALWRRGIARSTIGRELKLLQTNGLIEIRYDPGKPVFLRIPKKFLGIGRRIVK
jgi:hypothetical protein